MDRFIYWLAAGAIAVIRRLPLSVCFVLGQVIGAFSWAILPRYRRLARENLSAVFAKEMSSSEIRRLTFRHFTTLGANGICSFKVAALSQKAVLRIAPFVNSEVVERNILKGRGVVLAISHMGSWELYAQAAFQRPETRFGTIYQALRNPHLDDLINRDRQKGVETFDRKNGFQAAIALLRKPGCTAVLVDQSAGNGGIWMPFFNRLCSTSPLAAALAIRTNSVVVPAAIYTSGFARWRVVFEEEIPYDRRNPEQLTADIDAALERQIRRSPADWFWVHNRWKTPWPNLLIAKQKRGTYFPPGTDPSTLYPFRFLVRSPNWLGDAVMSQRAVRAFKHGRPDARLTVLAPAKLEAFWKLVPEVDEVVSFLPEDSLFSIAKKIRGRFEAAILLPNSLRSAAEAWLAGIPRRVGFRGHSRAMLLTQIIDEPKTKRSARPKHHAERYWRIAERVGAVEPPPLPPRPSSLPTPLALGVCPGAEYGPAKRWPAERFRRTMELVSEKIVCSWVVVGTDLDRDLATEILQGFDGNARDLTGRTSLSGLIEQLQTFRVLLTNDTGTMHLADYLGIPLVAVFGSTEPQLTGPRSPKSTVLRHQVECSPCFLRECPLDFRCMRAVSPEEAAKAILAHLESVRPEPVSV
ncbi:MAG TPA: lipopolysaccharide heptosyltransferase II [Terrimicrobiaceae bacterium]|nr:lipopolysaccharide heptosyltransferase II [Terrimicrobiaceae bacterium]